MKRMLFAAGLLVLVFGVIYGILSENPMIILVSVVGGFILMGVYKMIEILEGIHHRVLQVPFTENQLHTIITFSKPYKIVSKAFEIHPNPQGNPIYPLIKLDNDYYLRARVFNKYLSQLDNMYTFKLPNQARVTLSSSMSYQEGAGLFQFHDQVFVRLKDINIKPVSEGYILTLEYVKEED
ncbi:hypothetical protein [Paenibacillus dakarensis]|uniref:hypothetical protein n=1 Tax=Paenibacillus dakarensis TaxID=1527293 RepID=UPI0006D54DDC|nr:hypothetical protein [Paenibacillus dakarensis]